MDRRDWDDRYTGRELIWSIEPNVFLARFAADLPPGRALDLACGEGRNAVWLAERGWEVTGVDYSAVALAKAREMATARSVEARWVEANLLDYRPPVRAFDLVMVLYLHLPAAQRREVLRRAAGAVASGGFLFVVGHDSTNLGQGVGGPQDPAVLFTPAEIVAELGGLPLEAERAERVRRPVERRDLRGVTIDALVVARSVGLPVPTRCGGR
jgi:SAM-dependent methyltransferase